MPEGGTLADALRMRDERLMRSCIDADPIGTLRAIDAAMLAAARGGSWETLQWLDREDAELRERLDFGQTLADLSLLRDAYKAGELCLVLGAGVSQAAGLPGWKEMVVQLIHHAVGHDIEEARTRREQLIRDTAAEMGRLEAAEQVIARERAAIVPLAAAVREELWATAEKLEASTTYASCDLLRVSQLLAAHFRSSFAQHIHSALYRRIPSLSSLHREIARLVRLKAILTYNYDDLVEQALTAAGRDYAIHVSLDGKFRSVGASDVRPNYRVDVLHPHGLVPLSGHVPAGMDIVLSEQHYWELYGGNPKPTVVYQELVYERSRALIIGSSMTDAYMRQQLKNAHERAPHLLHYVALKVPNDAPRPLPDPPELFALSYSTKMRNTVADLRALGLRVFWMRGYEQLAGLLGILHEVPDKS